MMEPESSPFKEGKPPIDVQSWYTDGSSQGRPPPGLLLPCSLPQTLYGLILELVKEASGLSYTLPGWWSKMRQHPLPSVQIVGQFIKA